MFSARHLPKTKHHQYRIKHAAAGDSGAVGKRSLRADHDSGSG